MSELLKIGVVGLGTVGATTIQILEQNGDALKQRTGCGFDIVGVSARDRSAKRIVDISAYEWFDNPADLIGKVDVLLEMIGGSEGIAYDLVKQALAAGVHVVTANKAMVAHHGAELAALAEENNVSLMYEAAVAGGIPVIKAARESFAGNTVNAVYGILNGTCNYIMTEMRETGASFESVLQDAQDKGYAEADPAFDVDGVDAGHKVALLAAIAFGAEPDFSAVHMTGISGVSIDDVSFADDLGYRIKLLGIAKNYDGRILQVVEPCLVPIESPFAAIEGVYNAVHFDTDFVETPLLTGLGAGGGATASSVVSDLVDLARGNNVPTFGVPSSTLTKMSQMNQREITGSYFMRLPVVDKTGVVADVASILRDHDVSIETMLQHGHDPGQTVQLVLTTHNALYDNVQMACDLIERLDIIQGSISVMRIENNL